MSEIKNRPVTIRLTETLYRQLHELAAADRRSVSFIVQDLIDREWARFQAERAQAAPRRRPPATTETPMP